MLKKKRRFECPASRTGTKGRRSPAISVPVRPGMAGPERLVGMGFRHWMTGCATADVTCWERAWELYANQLGPDRAKVAVSELSLWVRKVEASACRRITVAVPACAEFCRDECLAVSMIAASQHKTCPAMRACAFALIESSMIDEVIDQSDRFATILHAVGQDLSPASIVPAGLGALAPASAYYQ